MRSKSEMKRLAHLDPQTIIAENMELRIRVLELEEENKALRKEVSEMIIEMVENDDI